MYSQISRNIQNNAEVEMTDGKLFIVSGPSGSGKSSICIELYKTGEFLPSVSMTTRKPREGEIDGVSYYFVSERKFLKTIEEGGFLEHTQIYKNRYGTPKAPVIRNLKDGKNVILEIEMEGAMNAKRAFPDAKAVYVLPPSMAELRKRLQHRGTETEEQLNIRLQNALSEIRLIGQYDYYLVNDDFETAVETLSSIVHGEGEQYLVPEDPSAIIKKYEEEQ